MKLKHMAGALLAALTLGAALPAAADDYGRGFDHGDFHGRGVITVRTGYAQFTVDRSDRMFWRLTDRPYNFRPGLTYVYTDRCNRAGCDVLVFSRFQGRPVDRTFAPRIGYDHDWRNGGPSDGGRDRAPDGASYRR